MPSEVQNNKPKAVRNCFRLLTSQLNSVLCPTVRMDIETQGRQIRCKLRLCLDCWERTFSWDFLQLETVGTSETKTEAEFVEWKDRQERDRVGVEREREDKKEEGLEEEEKKKEMKSSVFKWAFNFLWINTFSFVLGLFELSCEGVMTNVCVSVSRSFVLDSLEPHGI